MKNHNKKHTVIYLIAVIILLIAPAFTQAQGIYKLSPSKDASIKVLGSSNIHDWTMAAMVIESQGEFKFEGDELKSLTAFTLTVDAKSLKSE